MIYAFGPFELDTGVRELRRAGATVAVEPQVFDVLVHLVANRDRVVTKDDLLDAVWHTRFVTESALTTRIKAARRAVGDDGRRQEVIRTTHGHGYRFVAAVREVGDTAPVMLSGSTRTDPHAGSWPMVGRQHELDVFTEWFREGRTGGVLLTGPAGLGKTRLAEECLSLAAGAGLPIARAAGHPESRSIPFAALAHLLPSDVIDAVGADGELDRAAVFHRARSALRDAAGTKRMLLLIDDADQLDDLSRALVTSLVQAHTAFAFLTMRAGPGPTPFDHLLKDGHLMRLAVPPLGDDAVESLLTHVLGGPLVADSARRLRETAGGNPGILRQLVETAIDAGSLTEHDGVWRLTGPLQPTRSMEALVAERLRGLDDAHRHAAELLAVAGDVALDALGAIVDHEVLEDLEHRGLIAVRSSGRRSDVSLAHPLYGEVLMRDVPALRRRRIRRSLAEVIEAVGARRRDDRVRLVAWRVEGGGDVDPALVLGAARFALLDGDLAVAERLLHRAIADGGGARAALLLAELHFRRNEGEQVEAALAAIDPDDLEEAERAHLIRRRSGNLYYGLTEPGRALEVLDRAPPFSDPDLGRSVQAQRAILLVMIGWVAETLCCADPRLGVGSLAVQFEELRARSLALAAAGRGEDALALIEDGHDLHDRLDPDLTRPGRTIMVFNQMFALTELGRLDEARSLGARVAAETTDGGRRAWLAFALPRVELAAGNPVAALRASEPYANEARARGLFGAERWVLSLVGMARLLAGDAPGGIRDVERVRDLWPQQVGLFRSDRDRALAWLAAEQGDLIGARRVLRAGARDAGARGAYALEASLLHDIARFGDPASVAGRLAELVGTMQGPLIAARADHAAGAAASDPVLLDQAVAGFEALGSPLLAAEAAVDLATAYRAAGDRAAAAVAVARSRHLRSLLDGAVTTPALTAGRAVEETAVRSRVRDR